LELDLFRREPLSRLSYTELAALAARLIETAETIRNPSLHADLHQAAGAVSDLAGTRFGIEEIAASTHDSNTAAELLSLIGKERGA
jgi:hypothetical protein